MRNLEDRAYFIEPTMTNGEVSKTENCGSLERTLEDTCNDKNGDRADNEKVETEAKQNKDNFFDKQKIEKIVNGYVSIFLHH